MKLDEIEARKRLSTHDHGILCTVHAARGVDAVPVAFVMDDAGHVGVPVDLVKPKSSLHLQRERNLLADPRATLLIEHWDRSTWSNLWWVRAQLVHRADPANVQATDLAVRLARKYPQYRDEPFARILVLQITGITSWSATGS